MNTKRQPDFKYFWLLLMTCCYYKVNLSLVLDRYNPQHPIIVRQVAQYLIFKAGACERLTGEMTGGFNYSTVRHGVKKISNLIEPINGKIQDLKLKQDIETLTI